MNFAAQDRVYELARQVAQLKKQRDDAISEFDTHVQTCYYCANAPSEMCPLAHSLFVAMHKALSAYVDGLESWRAAKYGSET